MGCVSLSRFVEAAQRPNSPKNGLKLVFQTCEPRKHCFGHVSKPCSVIRFIARTIFSRVLS